MAGFLNWDSAIYTPNNICLIIIDDSKKTMLYCTYLGFSGNFAKP